ncbi:MAG: thiol peroxidase [Bacteroidetes bacterium]|uniref:Thiol peroxidase n=1 Tax=Phaeocystidibacter marisrubri TaxID=1577780 RepID=A0A6L3ZHG4_9FLAO|nr:thiol peroxidase [Phaeocystidibacter marisrubri]KAB2817446.1 thiol peroxidase [Phaeocystidibacter marisrubri]TNE27225.1 MAG: thiol peroxidase [Bacteroidota bacterium]GGH75309.1 putative thiol peroxidase [Phaeocystidibacter marisrubri]
MSTTAFKGAPVQLAGELPSVGSAAPDFIITDTDLQNRSLADFKGTNVVLNIFPSVDTGVCAASVRTFNKMAADLKDTKVVCVSKDLPFAHKRFCGAEGIENVISASDFRSNSFTTNYGVEMQDGPLAGLMARSIVVINKEGQVVHNEIVDDIVHEPNYDAAVSALK